MRRIQRFARALLTAYRAATRATRRAGVEWYDRARSLARKMARASRAPLARVCGVIAALSPRLHWVHNVNAAWTVVQGRAPTGVFKASVAKAKRIMAGEAPLRVLSGPKVRAFYRALMGDETATVVDVWTARAAGLPGDALTERTYSEVSAALTLAAREARTSPARLQAVTWVHVRGRA